LHEGRRPYDGFVIGLRSWLSGYDSCGRKAGTVAFNVLDEAAASDALPSRAPSTGAYAVIGLGALLLGAAGFFAFKERGAALAPGLTPPTPAPAPVPIPPTPAPVPHPAAPPAPAHPAPAPHTAPLPPPVAKVPAPHEVAPGAFNPPTAAPAPTLQDTSGVTTGPIRQADVVATGEGAAPGTYSDTSTWDDLKNAVSKIASGDGGGYTPGTWLYYRWIPENNTPNTQQFVLLAYNVVDAATAKRDQEMLDTWSKSADYVYIFRQQVPQNNGAIQRVVLLNTYPSVPSFPSP
jgi:hypothetical protein